MNPLPERVGYVVIGLGALGSAAAWQLARRGHRIVGFEQFALGHDRGASHDTSRILRHSYHTPGYVELTKAAYQDWADLEACAGEQFLTVTGGLDLFPDGGAIPADDYSESLTAAGIEFEMLTAEQIRQRWPQFRLGEDVVGLWQDRSAVVPAASGTAAMQRLAREGGARLVDQCPVLEVRPVDSAYAVVSEQGTVLADRVVICADAWTNRLLDGLGAGIPLTTTLEQVTYFSPPEPGLFDPERFPLWIWMDEPCFYGFPCYGESTVKAAQDCGGPVVDPNARTSDPDPPMQDLLAEHLARMLPEAGAPVRSLRCQYTLTPDRDFVVDQVPGHPGVVVGLGSAHGFKFAPTFGRLLADLAEHGACPDPRADLTPFRFDRPGLTDPDYQPHWLV